MCNSRAREGARPGRGWIVFHLGVALALFLGMALLGRRNEGVAVEANVTLSENTIPSLVHFERMQQALASMFRDIALEDLDQPRRERLAAALAQDWRQLEQEFAALQRLTSLPGESGVHGRLRPLLARLPDVHRDLVEAPDGTSARRVLTEELLPLTGEISEILEQLAEWNARGAAHAARSLASVHAMSRWISLALAAGVLASLLLLARATRRADVEVARSLTELDAFAGRVAHELKSPLQATTLAVGVLERLDLPPDARRHLELVRRNLRREAGMVDGLLALAQAGARPAPDDRVAVHEVIEELWPGLTDLAGREGAELVLDAPQDVIVATSRVALGSILENLLRNALLYATSGPPPGAT